jgi:hypothetical protein
MVGALGTLEIEPMRRLARCSFPLRKWYTRLLDHDLRSSFPSFEDNVTSVVSLKSFVKTHERQKQILRLTTPELKNVRGPVRSE